MVIERFVRLLTEYYNMNMCYY